MQAMAHSDPALGVESLLSPAELDDAEALVREAGWNQTAADWCIFLELGRAYAVRTGAGRVVATAAMLPYGRFAWISMVLVAGDHRRRGLATRLVRRCIAELTAADCVPVLDATPAGRTVYGALGFEETWSYHRWALRTPQQDAAASPPPGDVVIRPVSDAVWPALRTYDAAAFGADRGAVLARLRGRLPAAALVAERAGRVVGYLLGRDGRVAAQLGPLVAEDEAIAGALLARGLQAVEGPIYIDLADGKAGMRRVLEARGFAPERPLTRMIHHRRASFDDPTRTVAVVGPEFG